MEKIIGSDEIQFKRWQPLWKSCLHLYTCSLTFFRIFHSNHLTIIWCVRHHSAISQAYIRQISDISQVYHISDKSQTYLRHNLDKSQTYFRLISAASQTYLRCIYDISQVYLSHLIRHGKSWFSSASQFSGLKNVNKC